MDHRDSKYIIDFNKEQFQAFLKVYAGRNYNEPKDVEYWEKNDMDKCKCEWCDRIKMARFDYCKKHRRYMLENNLNFPIKTRHDPNEFIINGDICNIIINDKNNNFKKIAIVDRDDYEIVKNFRWCDSMHSDKLSYIMTRLDKNSKMFLHWLIIGKPLKGFVVDHINGDTLDNRRSNLRVCLFRENILNSRIRNPDSHGVSYRKGRKKKFFAHITVNNKTISLGYYYSKEEAKLAHRNASIKYFKEYSPFFNAGESYV